MRGQSVCSMLEIASNFVCLFACLLVCLWGGARREIGHKRAKPTAP